MLRSFIALELSDDVRKNLEGLIVDLKKGVQFTPAVPSWARAEGIHLTLKFLGNIEEGMVEKIADVLRRAAAGTKPFLLKVRNLGVFPSARQPRVLWVGVKDGDEESCALQAKIEEGLLPLGFEREIRPFHPHLTLARIKSLRGTAAMMKIVEIHKSRFVGECMIDRVILFRSELHPDGARYTKLIEAPFGSAAS